MSAAVDPTQCKREPIHIPGAIQPHGALLGIREPDLRVVLASANAAAMIGDGRDVHGRQLEALLEPDTMTVLEHALESDPRDANPLDVPLADGRPGHGLVHRSDGLLLLEVEPAGEDLSRFSRAYRHLVRRFERLRRADTLDAVCDVAAREVRRLTGHDRVMVYRFDQHANGQVIAEVRDDGLEPFLGLHYPASDIPPQARRLYVENTLRLIVDAGYEPVPVEPAENPLTGRHLDLSHASLRSVSPVHCQYLANMGVRSSLSISLLAGVDAVQVFAAGP